MLLFIFAAISTYMDTPLAGWLRHAIGGQAGHWLGDNVHDQIFQLSGIIQLLGMALGVFCGITMVRNPVR